MGLEKRYFDSDDFSVLQEALRIAEDRVTDYYRLSNRQWVRHPFEVITGKAQILWEEAPHAFAVLRKARPLSEGYNIRGYLRELYLICLQDHIILRALMRDPQLYLFPLLLYIFTHELIHIIRFGSYEQLFYLGPEKRGQEETVVHGLTSRVLKGVPCKGIQYVIDCYGNSSHDFNDYEEVCDANLRVSVLQLQRDYRGMAEVF